MIFQYISFGICIRSHIELPAFVPFVGTNDATPIEVSVGKTPDSLVENATVTKPFATFNENEFLYTVPNVARYYVRNGTHITIESLGGDWSEILLFFYSNCMAAVLFQRNIIPFHVSGVFVEKAKVILFAAPSRTGKSTTAVMLQEKGYAPFTDDTAVLFVNNGKCYAQASYPMIRLWQNSIAHQAVLEEHVKQPIRTDIELDKYGFFFHDTFVVDPIEVAGIVFLDEMGDKITIEPVKPAVAMQYLGTNIYRKQWLNGMKKQLLQFTQLTSVVGSTAMWKATRPKGIDTFQSFADAIDQQIIQGVISHSIDRK
ncbi:MAG: hypothetical protein ACK4LB_12655 [Spirosomataceae bacterium]